MGGTKVETGRDKTGASAAASALRQGLSHGICAATCERGMVTTNDPEPCRRLVAFRNHGIVRGLQLGHRPLGSSARRESRLFAPWLPSTGEACGWMSGDVHLQFCERPGVRPLRGTHQACMC